MVVNGKRDKRRGKERDRTGDCERRVGEREGDAKGAGTVIHNMSSQGEKG